MSMPCHTYTANSLQIKSIWRSERERKREKIEHNSIVHTHWNCECEWKSLWIEAKWELVTERGNESIVSIIIWIILSLFFVRLFVFIDEKCNVIKYKAKRKDTYILVVASSAHFSFCFYILGLSQEKKLAKKVSLLGKQTDTE